MTVRELSQLYYLNREIQIDTRRLAELEAKRLPGSPAYDGMPHATDRAGSRTEDVAVEIVDDIARLKNRIRKKRARCIKEQRKLEDYIDAIPDSMLRIIFTARFVDGLSWRGVADAVGGRNTPAGVKKKCYRYINRA